MAREKKVVTTPLYNGRVTLEFDPNATRYRYKVTDSQAGLFSTPVRGVTTILREIIDKPDLMRWPMNMANAALFGASFNEKTMSYTHDWKNALLQPQKAYTEDELKSFMKQGQDAHVKRGDRGKDVGTMFHRFAELFFQYFSDPLDRVIAEFEIVDPATIKMLEKMCKNFESFALSLDIGVDYLERPIYSKRLKYAGTVDFIGQINGKRVLLDFKTTNFSKKAPMGIYAEYFLQLGGYAFAFTDEFDEHSFDDLAVLNVSKEGKVNLLTAYDIGLSVAECERAFAFAVRLHDWLEIAQKKMDENAYITSYLSPKRSVEGSV